MTKIDIAVKLRQHSTPFVASLFSFLCICPSVVFSDYHEDSCTLTQYPDGRYTIICEGDGVEINYVERTNEVYIIANCDLLKSQLLSAARSIHSSLSDAVREDMALFDKFDEIDNEADYWASIDSSENMQDATYNIKDLVSSCRSTLQSFDGSVQDAQAMSLSLIDLVSSIQCGSCSTDNSGSCCDVDLTPILNKMNQAQLVRISITNTLALLSHSFRRISPLYYQDEPWIGKFTDMSNFEQPSYFAYDEYNVFSLLSTIHNNLTLGIYSINNYLYDITQYQLSSITNNLEILINSSTNFFSFFITNFSVKSVLGDWQSQDRDGSYYNFLTSHYIKVSRDDFIGMSDSQRSKTNWFARIETLIAALVFSDSVESTNTVDVASSSAESSSILQTALDGVSSVGSTSENQLSVFRGASQNLLSSLRSISSSFSRAADPGTVELFSFSSGGVRRSVSFETSDIRNLIEACHCATTLCWCFSGLLLLYYFLHWSVKTSYSLLIFAWGVFSAIFKH